MNYPNEHYLSFVMLETSGSTYATLTLIVPAGQYFKGQFSVLGVSATNTMVAGQLQNSGKYAYSAGVPNPISGNSQGTSVLNDVRLPEGTYTWAPTATLIGTVSVGCLGAFYKS